MGDAPTACVCGRMQLACKDVPNSSSLNSLAGLKSFVSGKSQKLHLQLPPLPGLSGVSLVIGCFCLALHVAASLLELSAFCFPRIHPLGSVPISGSFFMLGIFKQAFIELETFFWWVINGNYNIYKISRVLQVILLTIPSDLFSKSSSLFISTFLSEIEYSHWLYS